MAVDGCVAMVTRRRFAIQAVYFGTHALKGGTERRSNARSNTKGATDTDERIQKGTCKGTPWG